MDTNNWGVAEAKQRLSSVIKAAETAPQLIYSHSRLVGALISPAALEELAVSRAESEPPSLAKAFREVRGICEEEGYVLDVGERVDRHNEFAVGSDDASG